MRAVHEDDERGHDLVERAGQRAQVGSGVDHEGILERGPDGQHLPQPVPTGEQHHAGRLPQRAPREQPLSLDLDPGEVLR